MAVPKLSKIQQRLAGLIKKTVPGNTSHESLALLSQKPATPVVQSLREKPTHPHMVYMSRNSCLGYDHKDCVVISISDIELHHTFRPPYPNAIDRLYLSFNPTANREGWIQTEHRDQLTSFLSEHAGANIVVHCNEGSIRSPSLAMGLHRGINAAYCKANNIPNEEGNELYKLYHFVGTRWVPKTEKSMYDDHYIDDRIEHTAYLSVSDQMIALPAWKSFFETQGAITT